MVLPPWQPDPEHTSNLAVFGEGWIVFVFLGPIEGGGSMPSFRVRAPSGDRLATFFIAGDRDVFSDLRESQAYVCAEARPILPQVLEDRQFHVGVQGSTTAVVGIRMAPFGLVWRTGLPREARAPWTHADLACGIGGFTVAAGSLGASTVWACDISREAAQAYNVAHAHAATAPARCHPIELRSQWARPHLGRIPLPSLYHEDPSMPFAGLLAQNAPFGA